MKKILLILLIGVSSCQKSSNVTPDPQNPEIEKTIQESTKIGSAGSSTIYEFKHEGKTYIIVSKSFNDGGIAIIEHNKAQESEL
jgi:hypothetical protein